MEGGRGRGAGDLAEKRGRNVGVGERHKRRRGERRRSEVELLDVVEIIWHSVNFGKRKRRRYGNRRGNYGNGGWRRFGRVNRRGRGCWNVLWRRRRGRGRGRERGGGAEI